jgi:hypothetical protein
MSTLELIGKIANHGWMVMFVKMNIDGKSFISVEAQKNGAHLSVGHHPDLFTDERVQLSLRSFLRSIAGGVPTGMANEIDSVGPRKTTGE